VTPTKSDSGKVVELFRRQTATGMINEQAVQQTGYFRPQDLVSVDKVLPILNINHTR